MIIDKDNIKILLILLVVGLGIGYAYINSDLKINGTAQVNHANWDVHWANIQVKNGSVSASSPTISNQTTVNYSVTFNTPGDYYEFTVDAVNGGAIDAMIDTIDSKLNGVTITVLPDYLEYAVTYDDGTQLEENHELLANTTETYKVRVKYRDDIELNQLPTSNQTLNLQFTVTYRQATDGAVEPEHIVTKYIANLYDGDDDSTYAGTNNTVVYTGQSIPNGIIQYDTGTEALEAFRNAAGNNNIIFYTKHTLKKGVVIASYLEFVITPAMAMANPGLTAGTYEIRGGNANLYHETNKEVLLSAFGDSHCTEYTNRFYCNLSDLEIVSNISSNAVAAMINGWLCGVLENYSACGVRS